MDDLGEKVNQRSEVKSPGSEVTSQEAGVKVTGEPVEDQPAHGKRSEVSSGAVGEEATEKLATAEEEVAMEEAAEPPRRSAEEAVAQETAQAAPSALTDDQINHIRLELLGRVRNLEAQNQFFLQQVTYLLQAVNHHSGALQESENLLRMELKRFQTGGPQRAMASIFHKLFRDLLKVMNQLDGLVGLGDTGERTEEEQAWVEALKMLHGQLEFILTEWGCVPMVVEPFVTQFDPAFHEAVPVKEGGATHDASGEPIPEDTIVKVEQRGWMMQDTVLQFPQVVVR